MHKALSKIGAKYRWGASGPDAFDCSGLVMWAYRASGKSLPHSSEAMSSRRHPRLEGDLQPGDLVFFYSGPSHVGIYIGNGQIVHASNPSYIQSRSPTWARCRSTRPVGCKLDNVSREMALPRDPGVCPETRRPPPSSRS
jgi:cell wall-associated NlpC family hydrolase